jgi:hypothetical protein
VLADSKDAGSASSLPSIVIASVPKYLPHRRAGEWMAVHTTTAHGHPITCEFPVKRPIRTQGLAPALPALLLDFTAG